MGEITDVTRDSFKREVLEEKRPVLVGTVPPSGAGAG